MEDVEVVQHVPTGGELIVGMPVPHIMPVRGGGQLVRRTSTGAAPGQGC